MSKRRNPPAGGAQADSSVQLRWHSVANPDTPSVDIMSSPDPLNDTITADHVPSSNTRRVTRSQRAHKFLSLGTSPRKQAFELDTGNRRAARGGLVVSVEETDDDDSRAEDTLLVATQSPGAASRTPRPREPATTTTTVPLKYSVEDESSDVLGSTNATPRPRKTRIRTSNGTPIPKPTTRKRRREPTPPPGRRTPGRLQTVEDSMESDSVSDEPTQRSPTPKRRMRSPRNRAAEPSSELGTEPAPAAANPVRRVVRSRRQSIASDRSVGRADAADSAAMVNQVPTSEDDLQRDMTITEIATTNRGMSASVAEAELESDIWMTTMSGDATPKASAQPAMKPASRIQEREEERQPSVSFSEGDYGYLAPAASDLSSADEELPAESMTARRNDTIAQGEDFSMILMDSIPSLQASTRGVAPPPSHYSEIGDDTNLIINTTLESLRQGEVADREDEGEDDEDDDVDTLTGRESENDPAEEELATPEPLVADAELEAEPEAQSEASQPQTADSDENGRESENESAGEKAAAPASLVADPEPEPELEAQPDASQPEVAEPAAGPESESAEDSEGDLEAELEKMAEEDNAEFERQVEQEVLAEVEAAAAEKAARESESEPELTPFRQSTSRPSPAMSRSARLSQSPRKATDSSPLRYRVFKRYQTGGSPPGSQRGADSPKRTGEPAAGSVQVQESREDSLMDEDSFSDIPEEILEAAAPRHSGTTREYEELDDEPMEEAMDELEASQGQYAMAAEAAHFAEDAEIVDEHREAEFAQEQQVAQQARPDIDEPAWQDTGAGESSELGDDAFMTQGGDDAQEAEEVVEEAAEEQPLPSNAPVAQTGARRLPTPDDSPPNSPAPAAPLPTHQEPPTQPLFQFTGPMPQPSSTPRSHPAPAMQQVETAARRSGSSLEETPRNQISPPAQPQSLVQESTSAQHVRPALSSIVRAGRVLQSVTSDPPSPEARDRHLGSPFRSSGSKEPRSGSKEREGSGRLLSRSPSGRVSKSPASRVSKSPTSRRRPFGVLSQSSLSPSQARSPFRESIKGNAASKQPQRSPQQPSVSPSRPSLFSKSTRGIEPPAATVNQSQPPGSPQRSSLFRARTESVEPAPPATAGLFFQDEAPRVQVSTPGRVSANSSLHHSPVSEMSWVANEGPISPRLRGDNTLQEVVAASTRPAARSGLFAQSPVRPAFVPRAPEPEPVREPEPEPEQESEVESEEDLYSGPGPTLLQPIPELPELKEPELPELRREPVSPAFSEPELPELPREPESPEVSEPELPELPREPELPVRDDSTDIWDFEAERESPKRQRNKPFGTSQRKRKASQTLGREARPSKWMRENVQPLPSAPRRIPGPAQPAQPAVEEPISSSRQQDHSRLESEAEEFSLLARQRAAGEQQKLTDSAVKASRFDLSEFFSSPMAIPGKLAGKFFPRKSKPAEAAAPAPAPAMTTGSLFPQAPPMEQVSPPRRQNLFAAAEALSVEQARLNPTAPRPVLMADFLPGGSRFSETASGPAPATTTTTRRGSSQGSPEDSVAAPRRPNLFAAAAETLVWGKAQQNSTPGGRSEATEFFPGWSKPVEAAPVPAPPPAPAPVPAPAPALAEDPVEARRRAFPPGAPDDYVQPPPRRPNPFLTSNRETAEQSLRAAELRRAAENMDQRIQKMGSNGGSVPRPARPASRTPAKPVSTAPTVGFQKAPPSRQLTRDDIHRWRHSSAWSTTSSNASDDSFRPPLLRTLPPKDASPEKSSLRPATKPRTPGRVVEFTSSVLSPPEQELARQKRREREAEVAEFAETLFSRSMSAAFERDDNRREPPLLRGAAAAAAQQQHQGGGGSSSHDKENQPSSDVSDISMSDAPPLEARASKPAALSQTHWSNRHWLLMEKMIRARRERPLTERYENGRSDNSNSLVGKYVRARGLAMQIDRWHMDCVDAFLAQVGGWDETELVRRLFALLAAESDRKRAAAPRRKRRGAVMSQ